MAALSAFSSSRFAQLLLIGYLRQRLQSLLSTTREINSLSCRIDFKSLVGNSDFVSAKAEKASNVKNGESSLVLRINDDFINLTDFFVFLVRDLRPNELTGTKASLDHRGIDLDDLNFLCLGLSLGRENRQGKSEQRCQVDGEDGSGFHGRIPIMV